MPLSVGGQQLYSRSWRNAPVWRFGWLDHQPRYAAFLTPSPSFPHSSALGPEGLIDNWTQGPKPRLSAEQLAEVAQIVEAGPDREKDGVVRWRRIDLKRVIAERFGVEFHERYVGKLLKTFGISHISPRPRHPAQDERIVEAFKKTSGAR